MVESKKSSGEKDKIYFYSTANKYFEFSNFYESSFILDSKEWRTVEHYFQAQKPLNEEEKERIRKAATPREAKSMGSKVLLRKDWEEVKLDVMEKACMAKFSQNEELKKMLLSTKPKKLFEHTTRDKFWGDGGGGSKGMNMMGKILMKLRDIL